MNYIWVLPELEFAPFMIVRKNLDPYKIIKNNSFLSSFYTQYVLH